VFAATLVMVAFSYASLFVLPGGAALPNRPSPLAFVAASAMFVALPSVGLTLALLRPWNAMGWLFLFIGAGFVLGVFDSEYTGRAVVLGADLPAVDAVHWMALWASNAALASAITLVPQLFPDGPLPGRRWRLMLWLTWIVVGAATLASALGSPVGGGDAVTSSTREGIAGVAAAVSAISGPAIAVLGILSIGSLGLRFKRSAGIERQQLKWFLSAAAAVIVFVPIALFTGGELPWYAVQLGLAALPIAAGIAVLRYRLYDIDRIISRTIGWALLTGILVAVFAGAVIGLQALLAPFTANNTLAIAGSTLLAAALFAPLRTRVQRAVDRRFNRARWNADLVVAAFAAELRAQVELERLRTTVVAVVDEAVAPSGAAVWLRVRP
jgi:hypothetical protein